MSEVSQGPGWWQASDGKWYPPQSHPGYAPPPPQPGYTPGYTPPPQQAKPVYKRAWFWVVMGLVVIIGGCGLTLAVAGVAVNKANSTKHTAVYSITGAGTADITYDSFQNGNSGSSQDTGATLPWTKTITGSGLFTIYSVDAQLTNGSGPIGCTLTVDGKIVASHTSTGQYATVACAGGS